MTEEEARTKWCPFARVAIEWQASIGSANRGAADDEKPLTRCIGSACMAWRFGQYFKAEEGHPARTVVQWTTDSTEGYCGLAGKP